MNRYRLLPAAALCAGLLLSPVFARAQATPEPATKPKASAETPPSAPVKLDVFQVTTSRDIGYRANNSIEGTRTNTELVDIPQSITVLNEAFFRDIQAFEIRDIIDYEPTVQSNLWGGTSYRARGFSGITSTLLDGVEQRSGFGSQFLANIDRVEILKGPSAILYGAGSFGGLINRVTKRPRATPQTTVTANYGSDSLVRFSLDTTGPIWPRQSPVLMYRLNLALEDGDFFKQPQYRREKFLSPVLTWRITPNTALTGTYIYSETEYNGNYENIVTNGQFGLIIFPDGTQRQIAHWHSFNEPTDRRSVWKHLIGFDLQHAFTEQWQFRSQYWHEDFVQDFGETLPDQSPIFVGTTALFPRRYRETRETTDSDRMRNELVGDFHVSGARIRLLAGLSYDQADNTSFGRQSAANVYPAIDAFNPVYGQNLAVPGSAALPLSVNTNNTSTSENTAYYISTSVALLKERLLLQVGYRDQETENTSLNKLVATPATVFTSAAGDTFSYGAVYHLNEAKTLSLYANANEGFSPVSTLQPDGSGFGPQTGKQIEAGLKFDLWQRRIGGLVSFYRIRQEGVLERDSDREAATGQLGWQKQVPGQTSQGVDLSMNANLTNGWQAMLGYAYLEVYDTRTGNVSGHSNPKHAISGFTRYELKSGPLKGVFGTLGMIWKSGRLSAPTTVRNQPQWTTPEYFRVDASVGYNWKWSHQAWSASLRVRNLLNADDLFFLQENHRANIEPTRDLRAAISVRF